MSGRLFAVTVVFASLLTALTAGPVNAEPREAEELFDRPKSVLRYDIEDAEKGKADSVKYTRDGVVVVRKGGQELRLDQAGDWTIQDTSETKTPDGGLSAAYGPAYCFGSFANMQLIYGELFWGGTQTCDTRAYPHYIRVALTSRSGAPNLFSFDFGYTRSSTSLDYVRVATMYRDPRCVTATATQYRQQVIPASRGVEFPMIRDADVPYFACRF